MIQTKKTVKLSKIKQLIDLNDDSTNFDLSFNVSCKDDTPFQMLVVDQTTLDNSPNLEYKEVSGSINGNILADKNLYQNYFLILKSETPCEVDIECNKKNLPKTPESVMLPNEGQVQMEPFEKLQRVNVTDKKSIPWMKIGLISLVVIVGGIILWWLYKRKNSSEEAIETNFIFDNKKEYDKLYNQPDTQPVSKHITPKSKNVTPVSKHITQSPYHSSSNDSREFRPDFCKTVVSPDLISMQSSYRGDGDNSLLSRLKKFAR